MDHNNDIEKEQNVIDDIFSQADQTMSSQQEQAEEKTKPKKTYSFVKKFLIYVIVCVLIAIISFVGMIIWTVNAALPTIKAQIAQEITNMREHLTSIDTNKLSLEEQYTKELLEIVTDDEIVAVIDKTSFLTFLQGGNISFESLSEQTEEKIEQLNQKYKSLKDAQEATEDVVETASQSTTDD